MTFEQSEVSEIFCDIENNGYSIDALVLNAANLGIGQESLNVDIEDFTGVYKINVMWNFMMAREAAKQMKKSGGGSIVFVTSNSAIRVTENRCAYCSSKSAILAMSKSFAVDWGFVAGKTQTYEQWEGMWDLYNKDPENNSWDFDKWFHDLYRPSLHPYNPNEIKLIKRFCKLADEEFNEK